MKEHLKLNSGTTIPVIGFGTWQIVFHTKRKVTEAINAGNRLIDTAKVYGNEVGVGEAVRACGVPRDELFITTKLWNGDQGYDSALLAYDNSLKRLQLDYVDLYLIHWPSDDLDKRQDSWRALSELYKSGKVKAVGVSNYYADQIAEAVTATGVMPAVNQIEFHPFIYYEMQPTLEFCQREGIVVEAYSPLARGHHMQDPVINDIAEKHGKTNAQVLLRWCLQHGTVPIPKTSNPDRMRENLDVFDFKLTKQDMDKLNNLSG